MLAQYLNNELKLKRLSENVDIKGIYLSTLIMKSSITLVEKMSKVMTFKP